MCKVVLWRCVVTWDKQKLWPGASVHASDGCWQMKCGGLTPLVEGAGTAACIRWGHMPIKTTRAAWGDHTCSMG